MKNPALSTVSKDLELIEANRQFYDPLWTDARLVSPDRFNTWPLVSSLISQSQTRLEIAPGLRPRLPIKGTHFVDISAPAVTKLQAHGANAMQGLVSALPFEDGIFGLVCAFDIVEHVDDDDGALSELSRVAAPGATLLLSVPLHPSQWTPFDDFVGHCRRYEPESLIAKLAKYGFEIEQSAVYGMQPKSSRLLDLGMWFLTHRRKRALWWYNNVFMPIGVRFQKKLDLVTGMIDTTGVDEVLLVCRKVNKGNND
ncbi:class I SAM-dependent methyltransferase [Methylophilus flavus]|uniref:Class I SAM-dependent methyltransferase n=1 Tax=Methylophilus flavus TaxID=640084 RepID=A0ABW3PAK5_9PROT